MSYKKERITNLKAKTDIKSKRVDFYILKKNYFQKHLFRYLTELEENVTPNNRFSSRLKFKNPPQKTRWCKTRWQVHFVLVCLGVA